MDRYYFLWQIATISVALGGPNALDFTALLCEEPQAWKVQRWQDRTERDLALEYLIVDGVKRRAPARFALPGMTAALLRQEVAA